MGDGTVAREDGLWDAVRKVAQAAAGSAEAPAGFVRRELELGDEQVDVYARVPEVGAHRPTLVVVLARREENGPTAAELGRRFRLTPREAEVALLLAERRSNKEIARALDIAQSTARGHTERVLRKLHTSSRRDVAGIIEAGEAGGEGDPADVQQSDRLRFAS